MLLLDTCVLIWLASDINELSETARKMIGKNAGAIYVSSISAFEIAIKTRKKKGKSIQNQWALKLKYLLFDFDFL